MKDEKKNVEFEFWDFIERFHPAKAGYPHKEEMEEIRRFLRDKTLTNSEEGSRLVCRVLEKYGSAYGARAYLEYLECKLFTEAFMEYFVQHD